LSSINLGLTNILLPFHYLLPFAQIAATHAKEGKVLTRLAACDSLGQLAWKF
jgi:hypothetical protein